MGNKEDWMSFPGYTRYFVSNTGKIKVIKKSQHKNGIGFSERVLKSRKINGYPAHTLISDRGEKKTVYTHKAIAICFVSKPNSKTKLIVVHKDGNKANNVVENLEWRSFSDFMKTEFLTGRRSNKGLWDKRIKKYGPAGGIKPTGKKVSLSPEEIKEIYKLYHNKGLTLKKIANEFNCSASHIYNLLKRYSAIS